MLLELPNWFLLSATFTSSLSIFVVGTGFSWTSPVLFHLQSNTTENPFGEPITSMEESLIISLFRFGAIFGPFLSIFLIDRIGRKRTMIYFTIPLLISHLLTSFCTSIGYFYFARFFEGIGCGGIFATLPVYLGEIAKDLNRGFINSFMGIMSTSGILFGFILGPYTTIQSLSLACIIPLIPFYIVFGLFMPESPHFYIKIGNQENASKALILLRQNNNIQSELLQITKQIQEVSQPINNIFEIFHIKPIFKGLAIIFTLIFFQQFAGVVFLLSILQFIFAEMSDSIKSEVWPIVVGILQPVACFVLSNLVDKFGRKTLLLISVSGILFSSICLSFYFYLKHYIDNTDFFVWFPIANIFLMVFFHFVGLGPIPFILIGEYFPIKLKSRASTILISFNFLLSSIVAFIYLHLIHTVGFTITFLLLVLNDILAIIFIFIMIPETARLSFGEIQTMFYGEPKVENNVNISTIQSNVQ